MEIDLNALHARGQQLLGAYQARQLDSLMLTTGNPDTLEARYRTGLNNFNLNEAIRKASQAAQQEYGMGTDWYTNERKKSETPSGGGLPPGGGGLPPGGGAPPPPGGGGAPPPGDGKDERDEYLEWQKEKGMRSAEGAMRGFFAKFFGKKAGNSLATWAVSQIALGYDAETMIMQMRFGSPDVPTTDSMYVPKSVRDMYDERFPAMALREANNAAPLSEAQYVQQESSLWEIIDRTGLGPYVTAQESAGQTPITTLIANGVSPAEFASRAEDAEDMLNNANPETIAMLRRDYGWGQQEFITAMVDPEFMGTKSLAEAKRSYEASKLGGMSQRILGDTSFSKGLSRNLLSQDVQEREVASQLGQFSGMADSTIMSAGMTADQLGEGIWGSGKARAELRRENEVRRAGFSGTSNNMINAAGNTSLGSVNT